jgi:hypothetical protein
MKDENEFDYDNYIEKTHTYGTILMVIGIVLLLAVPFLIASVTGSHINWPGFRSGVIKVLLIYIPSSAAEFLIYTPMLGVGSVYLSFLTGNLTNLKLPCAFSSREIAQTQPGTKEDEIIMTLSIATSALVTMLVIALGVALLVPLTPILQNPTLKPAFDNVLPALFGALGYQYFIKDLKLSTFAMVLSVAICIFVPSMIGQTGTMIIVLGAVTLAFAFVIFKATQKKAQALIDENNSNKDQ